MIMFLPVQKKSLPLTMQENIKNLAHWIVDGIFNYWVLITVIISGFIGVITWMRKNYKKGRGIIVLIREYVAINLSFKSLEKTVNDRFDEVLEGQRYLQSQITFQNEAAQLAMWKANAKGQFIFANEAYCRLFDKDFSELRGNGWHSTIADSNFDKTLSQFKDAINSQTQSYIEYDAITVFGNRRVKAIFNVYIGKDGFVEFHGCTQLIFLEEVKTKEKEKN